MAVPTTKFLLENGKTTGDIQDIVSNKASWATSSTTSPTLLAFPLMPDWLQEMIDYDIQDTDVFLQVLEKTRAELELDAFDLMESIANLSDAEIPNHLLIRHICAMALYTNPTANNSMYLISDETIDSPGFKQLHINFLASVGGATSTEETNEEHDGAAANAVGGNVGTDTSEARKPRFKLKEFVAYFVDGDIVGVGKVVKILPPAIAIDVQDDNSCHSNVLMTEERDDNGDARFITKQESELKAMRIQRPEFDVDDDAEEDDGTPGEASDQGRKRRTDSPPIAAPPAYRKARVEDANPDPRATNPGSSSRHIHFETTSATTPNAQSFKDDLLLRECATASKASHQP